MASDALRAYGSTRMGEGASFERHALVSTVATGQAMTVRYVLTNVSGQRMLIGSGIYKAGVLAVSIEKATAGR